MLKLVIKISKFFAALLIISNKIIFRSPAEFYIPQQNRSLRVRISKFALILLSII